MEKLHTAHDYKFTITNMTREEFIKQINSIWYSTTKWVYPNEFIWDTNQKNTWMRLLNDYIEYSISDKVKLYIYYKQILCEIIENWDWKTLIIQDINWWDNPWFFIQLYSNENTKRCMEEPTTNWE